MDTYVNLTEKEFDALLDCIDVVKKQMSYRGGYDGIGWHEQEYRAFQRMVKKVNDRQVFATHILKIKGSA